MNIQDFKGLNYFRFLIPTIYLLSWIAMFAGPYFIPIIYRSYSLWLWSFLILKSIYQVFLNIAFLIKGNQTLRKVQNNQKKPFKHFAEVDRNLYHAFILPNYNQDINLLAQTLDVLAKHQRAQYTYLVFLAMQQHQQKSDKKAQQLKKKFKNKFRFVDYTLHRLRKFQQRGKASNVSWCAEHMGQKLKILNINDDDVIITVMDADSWAPGAYFNEIQEHLHENFHKRHNFIYQPIQIYTRNSMNVSPITRTYDNMFAALHATNSITCSKISFSFSNYSLSYNLVKKVGYWDTIQQCIAQDFHMTLKCHFKTHGEVEMIPIFTPFNHLNVQTGKGCIQDFKCKFWQLQRHSRVISQIGYSILMLFRNKFSFRSLLWVYTVIQMILMPILIPWTIFSMVAQEQIFHMQSAEGIMDSRIFHLLFNSTNIIALSFPFFYEYYKRKASKVLYGIQSPSWWYYLQDPLLYSFNILVMMTGSYIVGSFGGLRSNRQYVVGGKITSNKQKKPQLVSIEMQDFQNDQLI